MRLFWILISAIVVAAGAVLVLRAGNGNTPSPVIADPPPKREPAAPSPAPIFSPTARDVPVALQPTAPTPAPATAPVTSQPVAGSPAQEPALTPTPAPKPTPAPEPKPTPAPTPAPAPKQDTPPVTPPPPAPPPSVDKPATTPPPAAPPIADAPKAATPSTATYEIPADPNFPADKIIPAKAEKRSDGVLLLDGRFAIKGSGTESDPYLLPWDLLVSAQESYKPRVGQNRLPQRLTMFDRKWISISGFTAFPITATDPREMLVMLNQWDGCCIGVPPTPYDAVEVRLAKKPADSIKGTMHGTLRGRFRVDPAVEDGGWLLGIYMLEDATVTPDP